MKDSAGKPKIEQLLDEINWTSGVGEPAGVYWLEGRSRIAAHDSAAEARLLEQGAILVATLLFERDPREGTRPGSRVERIPSTSLQPMFSTPLHTVSPLHPTIPLHPSSPLHPAKADHKTNANHPTTANHPKSANHKARPSHPSHPLHGLWQQIPPHDVN